jgi:hypothetical protein
MMFSLWGWTLDQWNRELSGRAWNLWVGPVMVMIMIMMTMMILMMVIWCLVCKGGH